MNSNMNKELLTLLQQQVVNELNNARAYLAMSHWLDINGYFNLSATYRRYYEEELSHQDKLMEYLQDRNIKPETMAAEEPQCEFKGVSQILDLTLAKEQGTTAHWSAIWQKALLVKDLLTMKKADWFLAEQIEEEAKAFKYIDKLKALGGDDKCALAFFEEWVVNN